MTNWVFEVERQFAVLLVDLLTLSLQPGWFQQVYGIDYSCQYYKIVKGREYWRGEDYSTFNSILEKKYTDDPTFLSRYAVQTQTVCDHLAAFTGKLLRETNWKSYSNRDLALLWSDFGQQTIPVGAVINGRPVEFIQENIFPILEQLAARRGLSERPDEILAIINNVNRPLAYRDEPLDLLHIGYYIQQDSKLLDLFTSGQARDASCIPTELYQMIDKHKARYGWLNHPYAAFRSSFSLDEYVRRLEHIVKRSSCSAEIRRIEDLRKKDEEQFNDLLTLCNDPREAGLLEAARDFAFLRTHMAEVLDYAVVVAREGLLSEASHRLNLTDSQVVSMTVDEIEKSIASGQAIVPLIELDERAQAFAFVIDEGNKRILVGNDITSVEEPITVEDLNSLPSSVSGMIANRGVVTGPAKVLLDPKDNWKVNVGDILIATMTTPEYIAAMERASAFVTDEGGITCHAAITSREFDVPCIVGTETATRVFRDGDILRVDATTGVIQKI